MAIIFPFNLSDSTGNLGQVKIVEILPVGEQEFFMGPEIETLVGRPGIFLLHLIQESEKIEIQTMHHLFIKRLTEQFGGQGPDESDQLRKNETPSTNDFVKAQSFLRISV